MFLKCTKLHSACLDLGIHVLEEVLVVRVAVVAVHLQHKLEVQVLPVARRVDHVRIHTLPGLVL